MKKISKDKNDFVKAFIMSPYGISLIVIAFIIIAVTAVNPDIALNGLILCIIGTGGIIIMINSHDEIINTKKIKKDAAYIRSRWLLVALFGLACFIYCYVLLLVFELHFLFFAALLFLCFLSAKFFFRYIRPQTSQKSIKIALTVSLAALLVLSHLLVSVSASDIPYTNGQLSFSRYPVHINVRVEEPLSVEYATYKTLLALESINQTFGYQMILKNVTTFEDDHIDNYSSKCNPGYERAKLRLGAIINKHVDVTITFLHGTGPDVETWNGMVTAAGTSNWGKEIRLYYSDPAEMFFTTINETVYNIKTILHEFGHSFGLPHNTYSPIMFTSEEKDNPKNASRPELNISVNITTFSSSPSPELNSTADGVFQRYIAANVSYPVLFKQTYDIAINPHLTYHDYILDNSPSRNLLYVQILEINFETSIHYSINQYSIDISGFSNCWLPEELAACKA